MRSTRCFCLRRAMYSSSARVTAAFLVRSPPTLTACSISFGSKDRFVAMCHLLHITLHNDGSCCNLDCLIYTPYTKPHKQTLPRVVGTLASAIRCMYDAT